MKFFNSFQPALFENIGLAKREIPNLENTSISRITDFGEKDQSDLSKFNSALLETPHSNSTMSYEASFLGRTAQRFKTSFMSDADDSPSQINLNSSFLKQASHVEYSSEDEPQGIYFEHSDCEDVDFDPSFVDGEAEMSFLKVTESKFNTFDDEKFDDFEQENVASNTSFSLSQFPKIFQEGLGATQLNSVFSLLKNSSKAMVSYLLRLGNF